MQSTHLSPIGDIPVGKRIRALRTSVGLSAAQLAKELGCHRSYIYKLEGGAAESPSFDFVARLFQMYDLDTNWWSTGEGVPFRQSGQKVIPLESPAVSMALDRVLADIPVQRLRRLIRHFMNTKSESLTPDILMVHSAVSEAIARAVSIKEARKLDWIGHAADRPAVQSGDQPSHDK